MSMYNDILWREEGNLELCIANSEIVADYAKKKIRSRTGQWSFLGRGSEKKWYENATHTYISRTENEIMSLRA